MILISCWYFEVPMSEMDNFHGKYDSRSNMFTFQLILTGFYLI
jgi:hypothetical protein